jgi:hypothetical protein
MRRRHHSFISAKISSSIGWSAVVTQHSGRRMDGTDISTSCCLRRVPIVRAGQVCLWAGGAVGGADCGLCL